MQLQQRQEELKQLGLQVLIVTFETRAVAENYARQTGVPFPILLDESRSLYAAYGMQRGSHWQVLGPAAWGEYIKLLFRGRRLRRPTGDPYQLGGDVLIDPAGIVRLHHVSRNPADRPDVSDLIETVRKLSGTSRTDAANPTGNETR